MNIFVTVGSKDYQFNRLIKAMDKNNVFMQIGKSMKPKKAKYARFMKPQDLYNKMQWADVIVGHGGISTIITAINMGKKIVIVPRQEKFKEHVDNHQVIFSNYCKKKYGVPVVYDFSEIWESIQACSFPKPSKKQTALVKEVKKIIDN